MIPLPSYFSLGEVVDTAIFFPKVDVSSQNVTVNISIVDDEIALEDEEILVYSLINAQGATLASPSDLFVAVTDDDGRFIVYFIASMALFLFCSCYSWVCFFFI